MTGQIPDEVSYRGRGYAITAVEGEGLFDPAAYGFELPFLGTGCWRGYIARYTVRRDRLTLTSVEIGRSDHNERIALHGTTPRVPSRAASHLDVIRYEPSAPVGFTGRLLVGDDYVHLGYLHMGFTPAWLFANVRELVFAGGRLSQAYDRSAELAAVREHRGPDGLRPRDPDDDTRRKWIDATFSLSFAYSWPNLDG